MIEKVIYLEGIDPVDFLGVNNSRFDRIRHHFPKLKILSRGDEIRISGEMADIESFELKMDILTAFLHRYNTITPEEIDELILSKDTSEKQIKIEDTDIILYGESGKPVRAQTINQRKLVEEFSKNDLALAVRSLKMSEVKKIILTRPAVEAGERLGFLPGDFKEKLDPYLQPLYDALNDMIPSKKLKTFMEEGIIQIAPLAYMRGRTLDNAFVILDEAQNATINQLKMFLTRMGRNAKFIVTGDVTQIDLPKNQESGLILAEKILGGIRGISVIHFDQRDIVRHRLVKSIVDAYNNHGNNE
jgi:phosphate starvation-inducible PhoH-like protein